MELYTELATARVESPHRDAQRLHSQSAGRLGQHRHLVDVQALVRVKAHEVVVDQLALVAVDVAEVGVGVARPGPVLRAVVVKGRGSEGRGCGGRSGVEVDRPVVHRRDVISWLEW